MEMRWRYIVLYLVVVASYAIVTLTSPAAGNTYQLSQFELGLMRMGIVLPVILIWYIGVQGATHLKRYVSTRAAAKDRRALGYIANGILVLVTGLIITSLVGTVRPYALANGWIEPFRISYNYLNVFFPLVGLYMVYRGTARLLADNALPAVATAKKIILGSALALIFAGLVAILFTNPYRTNTPDPGKYQSFYLGDASIIGTIMLPYLLVWFLGGLAALNIRYFSQQVRQAVSQTAFRRLAVGIFTIIGSLMFLQILGLLTGVLGNLGLASILFIIYLLLFVYGTGYYLIFSGARRLNRGSLTKAGE